MLSSISSSDPMALLFFDNLRSHLGVLGVVPLYKVYLLGII